MLQAAIILVDTHHVHTSFARCHAVTNLRHHKQGVLVGAGVSAVGMALGQCTILSDLTQTKRTSQCNNYE